MTVRAHCPLGAEANLIRLTRALRGLGSGNMVDRADAPRPHVSLLLPYRLYSPGSER